MKYSIIITSIVFFVLYLTICFFSKKYNFSVSVVFFLGTMWGMLYANFLKWLN